MDNNATGLPCREKYWSEIDANEKIERLRSQVKFLEGRIDRLLNKMERLEEHNHLEGGIVVSYRCLDGRQESVKTIPGPNVDDVYI